MSKNRSGGGPESRKAGPQGAGAQGAKPQAAADAVEPGPGKAQKKGGAPPLDLVAAKLTDVGRTRDHNEDYVGAYVPPDPQQRARKGVMYAVADGMGGHQAGEVASQGAVELAIGQYYSDPNPDVGASLVRAFHAANRQIHEQAKADEARSGMGTTLVAAVVLGRKVFVASVGDSRAYLINQKGIRQITEDHSWVEEQVRLGLLTREEARRHPQRNVVTRALGSRPSVEVDLFEGEIAAGDHLLLCTDGVTGHLEDRELAALVQAHPPEEAARQIVAQANERGGHDNMGIVIVSTQKAPAPAAVAAAAAPAPAAAPAAGMARRRRRVSPLVGALAAVAVVAVLAAAGLGAWWLMRDEPAITSVTVAATTAAPAGTQTPEPSPPTGEAQPTEGGPATAGEEATPSPSLAAVTGEAGAQPLATDGSPQPPTATLAPTLTSSPVARNTSPPRATDTQSPAATPTPYPPPVLVTPNAAQELSVSGPVLFQWRWDHAPLAGNDYFDLRIWSEVEEMAGDEPRGVVAPLKETEARVDLEGVESIQEYRDQTQRYYWAVVVVRKPCPTCKPRIVGRWSEERLFFYGGASSAPGAPGPPPGEEEPEPTNPAMKHTDTPEPP